MFADSDSAADGVGVVGGGGGVVVVVVVGGPYPSADTSGSEPVCSKPQYDTHLGTTQAPTQEPADRPHHHHHRPKLM